ncbi:hypothetical protein [Solicola sp. PLA-1-18]|uniref:hypothetical protein n=1 Tax=Solicola sp. PLA-1-18 TaxID=3380532 RepID=UPI003B80B660
MPLMHGLRGFFLSAKPWQIAVVTALIAAVIAAALGRFVMGESWGESLRFAGIFFVIMAVIWTVRERWRQQA